MPESKNLTLPADMEEPVERVERIKKQAMEGLEAPATPDGRTVANKAAYVSWLKGKMLSSVGNGVTQDVMGKYMGKLRRKVNGK